MSSLYLEPGTLWPKIRHQTQHGLDCGALQPIETQYEWVEQSQIRFLVRILENLRRKQQAKQAAGPKPANPFLPYESDLFVTHISQTHLCLLNKYNVVDHHSLIVTRAFESQETWLTYQDFEALWACLKEVDGFAFYNGGKLAGASQGHKHLQLVPLPMGPTETPTLPIEPAIASAQISSAIITVPILPFRHALASLESLSEKSISDCATETLACYCRLLAAVELPVAGTIQRGAYNLLMTRRWMMIVPRSQEAYQSIPVNALGFAGSFLVKNAEQLAHLKQLQPLTILKAVGL
ncbi:MAG: phosphorylase [Cyanobacteria bacterium P01_D01_bin.128]